MIPDFAYYADITKIISIKTENGTLSYSDGYSIYMNMRGWLRGNFRELDDYKSLSFFEGLYYVNLISFRREEDLLAFKLRFGEYISTWVEHCSDKVVL